jgi:stage II sporulation protein D
MISLFLCFGFSSSRAQSPTGNPSEIRVQIYSLHSISRLTLTSLENASWKPCLSCRAHALSSPIDVEARGDQLQYGNSQTANSTASRAQGNSVFFVTGKYRLEIRGEHPLENSYPLEITAKDGSLKLVLRMLMEDYVAAVLAGESSNFQSDEALKAMAVSVRTYAVRFRGRHQAEHFDFCDTTHCQDLRLSAVTDRHRAAAEATEGELLWFHGTPAATYYHQNCGGTTAAAAETWPGSKADYLEVHPDSYCLRSEHARWESRISKTDLASALAKAGIKLPSEWRTLRITLRNRSGRAQTLDVIGKDGNALIVLSASTLRFAVGRTLGWSAIKSDLYELKDDGNEILFSGRGSGHGVGLCQEGADAMGSHGKNYREILAFYFPGTALGVSAQGLAWRRLHSEKLDLLTTDENADSGVLAVAESALRKIQLSNGLDLRVHPTLKLYPTVAIYRDSTGEPGWVAATTRGGTIRLQPLSVLKQKGILESTLRHEFLHMLVESNARAALPLWFREGLVLYLADENRLSPASAELSPDQIESALRNPQSQTYAQMQRAYASARATVRDLVARRGKSEVIGWLSRGIPAGALASASQTPQH